jgi:hypothetical protein
MKCTNINFIVDYFKNLNIRFYKLWSYEIFYTLSQPILSTSLILYFLLLIQTTFYILNRSHFIVTYLISLELEKLIP